MGRHSESAVLADECHEIAKQPIGNAERVGDRLGAPRGVPTVTLLDLGIREGAAVYFLGQLGYAEAAAFNAAFLLFCINLLVPAVVGLPFVFRLKLGPSD